MSTVPHAVYVVSLLICPELGLKGLLLFSSTLCGLNLCRHFGWHYCYSELDCFPVTTMKIERYCRPWVEELRFEL
jgi:hypothetical protein